MWLDGIVVVAVVAWLTATVIRHLPVPVLPGAVRRRIDGGWAAWLVPSWNFFAPVPGTHSYVLLYRDVDPEGGVGPWRQLSRPPRRSWLGFVWNPGKTASKALVDLCLELARMIHASARELDLIKLSVPYLTALNHVTALPRLHRAAATQFSLLQRSAITGDDKVLLVSAFHRL